MAAPSFTALNGQIKTPWRWYDGQHKLTQYQPQCYAELDGCIRNAVLCPQSALPPFQFPRPSSIAPITSWKLYDVDGMELVDLAAEIPLIELQAFSTFDYVIYAGTILSTPLESGIYYAQIITDGVIYYAEPVQVACDSQDSNCFRRLTWTNCGNVGNTYYAGGFVQKLWLRSEVVPVYPTPSTRIESEEQADGSVVETFRRKEVRYQLRMGLVPWHIAEAVKEIELMDTVRLYHLDGDGYDTLTDVKVEVAWDEELSECMPEVRVTFLLEAAAVACCDEFDRPCLAPCVTAEGFVSDVGPGSDGDYLDDDVARYITYVDGVDEGRNPCESGCANVITDEVEAIDHGENIQTYLWNIQLETWVALALVSYVDSNTVGPDCEVLVRATITDGYSGVLQFFDGFTWTDANFDTLTAEDWAANLTVWVKESGAQFVRVKVVVGTCTVGYSAAWPTNVSCS